MGRVGQIHCETDPTTGVTSTSLTAQQRALLADCKSLAAKGVAEEERDQQVEAYGAVRDAITELLSVVPLKPDKKTDKKAPADAATE